MSLLTTASLVNHALSVQAVQASEILRKTSPPKGAQGESHHPWALHSLPSFSLLLRLPRTYKFFPSRGCPYRGCCWNIDHRSLSLLSPTINHISSSLVFPFLSLRCPMLPRAGLCLKPVFLWVPALVQVVSISVKLCWGVLAWKLSHFCNKFDFKGEPLKFFFRKEMPTKCW